VEAGEPSPSLTVVIRDLDLEDTSGNEETRSISKIVVHPMYNVPGGMSNDVALHKLASPVTTITPVEIATDASQNPTGALATVIGWGALSSGGSFPTVLQNVDVPGTYNQSAPWCTFSLWIVALEPTNAFWSKDICFTVS
jgi:trypsin